MNKEELYQQLNEGILNERLSSFERNLERNLSSISRFGGMKRVVDLLRGKHVIIAAAGPSLSEKIDFLKRASSYENCAIISVDIALKPLVFSGIKPDFVISCETIPSDFFSGVDTSFLHLIAFSCISNSNLRKWRGDVSFYNWMVKRDEYQKLWDKAGTGLGYVSTGGVVTTQAVGIALGCGAKSLLLVGNDLGYSDSYYAKGTDSSTKVFLRSGRYSPLPALEYDTVRRVRRYFVNRDGKNYSTHHQFLAAKYWLEELFQKTHLPVLEMSKPGCNGEKIFRVDADNYIELLELDRSGKL